MASFYFYTMGFTLLCLLVGNEVEGRLLQLMDKKTSSYIQSGVLTYSNKSIHVASRCHLFSEMVYHEGAPENIYSKSDSKDDIRHWATVGNYDGEFYGAMGTINVYGLHEVKSGQQSSAQIWVSNHDDGHNVIQAGWQVLPEVYGDNMSHFYMEWTIDNYQETGCINLQCKGFILENSTKLIPGAILEPVSTYNGQQYEITLKISKDLQTGDWWLHYGPDGNNPIGHWPNSLFTGLSKSASNVVWGGYVGYSKNEMGPPMGSGHFPEEGDKRAAYVSNLKIMDRDGKIGDAPLEFNFIADKEDCYNIVEYEKFYFGGPGCND